jgi:hypothetical protein
LLFCVAWGTTPLSTAGLLPTEVFPMVLISIIISCILFFLSNLTKRQEFRNPACTAFGPFPVPNPVKKELYIPVTSTPFPDQSMYLLITVLTV